MIVLVQSSFHTTWGILFEMELELNTLDQNGNELEHEIELEDMKRTAVCSNSDYQEKYILIKKAIWHLAI